MIFNIVIIVIIISFYCCCFVIIFFAMARQPLWGLGRLIFRGFRITLFRHTTLGWTPLDEGSAPRRDLYLTTHNTHKFVIITRIYFSLGPAERAVTMQQLMLLRHIWCKIYFRFAA